RPVVGEAVERYNDAGRARVGDGVLAGTAAHAVGSAAAVDVVVAPVGADDVVATPGVDRLTGVCSVKYVVTVCARDDRVLGERRRRKQREHGDASRDRPPWSESHPVQYSGSTERGAGNRCPTAR